ncbi:MAG: hypothetical protein V4712_02955 [Pseudomonadota bacterium]
MQGLARLVLTLALAASFGATLWSGAQIARDPTLRPIIDRTADQIVAATDRIMAREATPERLTALINTRLREAPRNWVALQALAALATERAIPLPATYAPAYDADHSLTASASDCAACAYDPASCTLSNVLICQAPVALTPVGDFFGVGRAGWAYWTDAEVDRIDLTLSLIGLGATAAILASGGSSGAVKAGASTAKLARSMGLMSPRLTAMVMDAARRGVDWAALPAARSPDDLARLIRADALAPLTATVTDLNRLRTSTSATDALHLLPLIDDAADARRLARAGDALGPRLVARAEVLGKARLLRATTRLSNVALTLTAGLAALLASLTALIGGGIQSTLLRALRRRI